MIHKYNPESRKKINKFLKNLFEQKEENKNKELKDKIMEFFKKNPKPTDKQIHSFAEKLGIDHDLFEEQVYAILGSFLGEGRSKTFTGSYDPEQLKMGIEVEYEHTSCPRLAERIAKDHLAELPDYYTRLEKMEEDGKKELGK